MLEGIVPFHPLDFFQWRVKILEYKDRFIKGHQLPLFDLEPFSQCACGYSLNAFHLRFQIARTMKEACFPDYQRGDRIEIFIDTRSVKTARYLTRYCHHFVCFFEPIELDGKAVQAVEVTRFRGEEQHPLCDPSQIEVSTTCKKGITEMVVLFPKEILVGFEPLQFRKMGFSFKVTTAAGETQVWGAASEDFPIEQQPQLWPTVEW